MSEQANLAASATAADVMRPALTTVEPQAHVAAAAYLMKHAGTTALMVLATQADQPARTAAAMSASRARAGEAGKIESSLTPAGQAAIPARWVRLSMAAW